MRFTALAGFVRRPISRRLRAILLANGSERPAPLVIENVARCNLSPELQATVRGKA